MRPPRAHWFNHRVESGQLVFRQVCEIVHVDAKVRCLEDLEDHGILINIVGDFAVLFVGAIATGTPAMGAQSLHSAVTAPRITRAVPVRGSYLARVPRSSLLARVHREFVHHIVEGEVHGQEERQHDRREDRQQREENGEVEENETHNMSA